MQIQLTIKNYRCFPDETPLRFDLTQGFTAFVGANNSGKSSLLRLFYEIRALFSQLTNINQLVVLSRGQPQGFPFAPSVTDANDFFSNVNGRDAEINFEFSPPQPMPEQFLHRVGLTLARSTKTYSARFVGSYGPLQPHENNNYISNTLIKAAASPFATDLAEMMATMSQLSRILYIGPFRNAINVGTNEDYFDIQVGQSFVRAWRNYKTGPIKNQNETIYKLTADIQRIFGFHNLEINPSPDDDSLQIFVDGRSYRLHEVGSGLAQFIIVLANVAIKRPSFILIDEPELNLHPSLQLDFLTTLASYATEGVVFSTHNIGLARAAADRVYGVRRVSQGRSEVYPLESIPRLSDFVGELSFYGYKELGFDRILLVEGPTEVRTIQQFLRMLKKEHKIVLLPLGGSSLINGVSELELEEVKRISDNASALIDSERSAAGEALSPAREAFRKVCAAAKIDCHVLERRATENYLSERAIQAAVGATHTVLAPYERLGDRKSGWGKAQNWKIAREMNLKEIESTDLHAFLNAL
jgi:predicted ATPase